MERIHNKKFFQLFLFFCHLILICLHMCLQSSLSSSIGFQKLSSMVSSIYPTSCLQWFDRLYIWMDHCLLQRKNLTWSCHRERPLVIIIKDGWKLKATLSPRTGARVLGVHTSKQVWGALETIFLHQSQNPTYYLPDRLQNINNGTSIMGVVGHNLKGDVN